MSVWDTFPAEYRSAEVRTVLAATRAGECAALVGLSGSGKSNLVGFLLHRQNSHNPAFVLVDGNRARPRTAEGLLALALRALNPAPTPPSLPTGDDLQAALEMAVEDRLQAHPGVLCLLLDRYDALDLQEQAAAAGPLRALRDAFKYRLTYVTATRHALETHHELAELFYAHTVWLGPLSTADALWSAGQYAARQGLPWDSPILQALVDRSWGYPALLRACCEAHAQGCALDIASLRAHPAVRQRVQEFWSDSPTPEELQHSGLVGQPLLEALPGSGKSTLTAPPATPDWELTALEHRLLDYFQAHAGQVCAKDDLIRAVWPEDRVVDGLRDDSLAQLVRRLRQKIESDPSHPIHIQTLPGRGYRYV